MESKPQEHANRSIALYCRVSTDEQAKDGLSLHEQQERLESYCRAMGWQNPIQVYVEKAISAKNTDRPELTKLMKAVKNNKIAKVLVTKLDRISRKLLDLLNLINIFYEYKVDFVSISESFDTNTPSGRLTMQVLGAVAEFERESIRERVFETMHYAARQGKWMTQSPYGYQLLDKKLVVFEPEAKIVKLIFEDYLNKGMGYQAIAKKLNFEEIPSKLNKGWSTQTIKLLLSNPVYKGTLVWNRSDSTKDKRTSKDDSEWITVEDAHDPIIDKKTWNAVQNRMKERQIAPRAKSSPHLLGGLLKCGKCEASMVIGWSGSKNNRYRVYRCSTSKNKGTCNMKQFRADDVEAWFKQGLVTLFQSVDHQAEIKVIPNEDYTHTSIIQKIRTSKKRYERKVEAYAAGLISLEDLDGEKERLDGIIMEAEGETYKSDAEVQDLFIKFKSEMEHIEDVMNVLNLDNLKRLIQIFTDKIFLIEEGELNIILII
ncbi:recombinase family protein [Guptibacillus hwajinpoensis]|uniref:Site-specific DNA recombinase n=1 Tax=Guptibacillus hwajinpoensis TaxID=208199 RepID=A0ABU0K1Y9_9BACL|nr:recombinase family protein [Alkalihalobacillus hemicentroti]MDQ0482695.1 site-specific DNA recombinase [Alkalihalobacillus hemicentroti]